MKNHSLHLLLLQSSAGCPQGRVTDVVQLVVAPLRGGFSAGRGFWRTSQIYSAKLRGPEHLSVVKIAAEMALDKELQHSSRNRQRRLVNSLEPVLAGRTVLP
jgi:hypothetical protein